MSGEMTLVTEASGKRRQSAPAKTAGGAAQRFSMLKRPLKEKRAEYRDRVALAEAAKPLYTRAVGEIPPADKGTVWSKARIEHLLNFLMAGGMASRWLRAAGISEGTLYAFKRRDPAFAEAYNQARSVGMDALAEEALELASTPYVAEEVAETTLANGDKVTLRKSGDNVYARKLAVWTRLELLKKWAPDRYGDKVTMDVSDTRAAKILEARKRLQQGGFMSDQTGF